MPVPLEVPIKSYPVPVIEDAVLLEFVDTEIARYQPLQIGTPHPNVREYPGYKLGSQQVQDNKLLKRVWIRDALNQDVYNYALKYSSASATHPIFLRAYRERRDTITPRTRGSALQVVYRIALTNAGTGYDVPPLVTFTGGAGSGATAVAVINPDGTLAEIVLTNGGSGYTSAPTVVITSVIGGVGAAATAYIQPTGAVLVDEEFAQYPQDSEFFAQYLQAIRSYETLPGPWVPFTRYDDDLGPIQGRSRAVLSAGQVSTLTATGKTSYAGRDGSSIVLIELEEVWSNGTGVGAGNDAYPILTRKGYEQETGAVMWTTRQLVALPASPATLGAASGAGVVVDSYIDFFNEFLGRKVTVTMAIPGDRTEHKSVGFVFPAIATIVTPGGWTLTDYERIIKPPWRGTHYDLISHRSATKAAEETYSYSLGPVASVDTFSVFTNAGGSHVFPIDENTIHNAFTISQGGDVLESFDASSDNAGGYDVGDNIIIQFRQRRWKGPIWENVTTEVSE